MCLPLSKSTVIEVGRRHGLAWQLAILNQKSKVYLLSRPLPTATLEEHLPAKKGKQELDISKGGEKLEISTYVCVYLISFPWVYRVCVCVCVRNDGEYLCVWLEVCVRVSVFADVYTCLHSRTRGCLCAHV